MDPQSPFYVARATDRQMSALIARSDGATCAIKGPRQTGKSSLLVRALAEAQRLGKRTVFLDFQAFDSTILSSATSFYKAFSEMIADKLGLETDIEKFWNTRYTNKQLCTKFVQEEILPVVNTGLALGIDEVDRIIDCDFSMDFFSMLRLWHNERAQEYGGSGELWKSLDLILATSSEPRAFIPDINQSPFNVAEIVVMRDFTPIEASQMSRIHNSPLTQQEEARIYALLSGHPFLTHLAIYYIVTGMRTPEELIDESDWEEGPFGEHLRTFSYQLFEKPELRMAFQAVLDKGRCEPGPFYSLSRLGLVSGSPREGQARCELYRRYYKSHLSA
jgi:hypothetical protein